MQIIACRVERYVRRKGGHIDIRMKQKWQQNFYHKKLQLNSGLNIASSLALVEAWRYVLLQSSKMLWSY